MDTESIVEHCLESQIAPDNPDADVPPTIFTHLISTEIKNSKAVLEEINKSAQKKKDIEDGSLERNTSVIQETLLSDVKFTDEKERQFPLYTDHSGPQFYQVDENTVTRPILAKNLPEYFKSLPLSGRPEKKSDLDEFLRNKLKNYLGLGSKSEEFAKLEENFSVEKLRTGQELDMNDEFSADTILFTTLIGRKFKNDIKDKPKLKIHKQLEMKLQQEKGRSPHLLCKLKYRGMKIMPLVKMEDDPNLLKENGRRVEPGKDVMFKVRIYRGFPTPTPENSQRLSRRWRHAGFSVDVVMPGPMRLEALRDRFVCANDAASRLNVAEDIEQISETNARTLYPSAFLFINNVFYVDEREGCHDLSEPVRKWAKERGFGTLPCRNMHAVLQDIPMRLGHPEVFVHQGNCEHLFTFSDARVAAAGDPAPLRQYPLHSLASAPHVAYCTTCAEFGAKWVVRGCERVPFDPAFFCDVCMRMYLYKDGKPMYKFEAFAYPGNELNLLKPVT